MMRISWRRATGTSRGRRAVAGLEGDAQGVGRSGVHRRPDRQRQQPGQDVGGDEAPACRIEGDGGAVGVPVADAHGRVGADRGERQRHRGRVAGRRRPPGPGLGDQRQVAPALDEQARRRDLAGEIAVVVIGGDRRLLLQLVDADRLDKPAA